MPIILALLATLLMSALGAALVMTSSTEALIAANFRAAQEGLYAADAAIARAMDDLTAIADWNTVLDGSASSGFVDGPASSVRTLADGSPLDLRQTLNLWNCRQAAACTASDLIAHTAQRPWGANNPVWRLFAYGPVSALLPAPAIEPPYYVIVMVADDPSENDNDPLQDGHDVTNPGTGILTLRAEAFGPRGAGQVVEVTVARPGTRETGVRALSWLVIRQGVAPS